jgi:hypothetical protein
MEKRSSSATTTTVSMAENAVSRAMINVAHERKLAGLPQGEARNVLWFSLHRSGLTQPTLR